MHIPTTSDHRLLRGLAAGDKNGGPIRLAMLLYSHVKQHGFSSQGVFQAYYNWVTTEGFDTGPTLAQVCLYVQGGATIQQAVEQTHWDMNQQTAGVGPSHRVTPLAIFLSGKILDDAVLQEARLSHFSPLAGTTAMFTARLCSALLQGATWEEAKRRSIIGIHNIPISYLPIEKRHRGGFAPNVLQTALSFLEESSSFACALDASLQFAGPNNYCPVLVGSIGACLFPNDERGHPW